MYILSIINNNYIKIYLLPTLKLLLEEKFELEKKKEKKKEKKIFTTNPPPENIIVSNSLNGKLSFINQSNNILYKLTYINPYLFNPKPMIIPSYDIIKHNIENYIR